MKIFGHKIEIFFGHLNKPLENENADEKTETNEDASKVLLNPEQRSYLLKKIEKYDELRDDARFKIIINVILIIFSIVMASLAVEKFEEFKDLIPYLCGYGVAFLLGLKGVAKFWEENTELGNKVNWLYDLIDELSNSSTINATLDANKHEETQKFGG